VDNRPWLAAGKPELREYKCVYVQSAEDDDECEYLVAVKWIKQVPRDDARFRRRAGLFTPRRIVASLSRQLKTQEFLEQQFKVKFEKLLSAD